MRLQALLNEPEEVSRCPYTGKLRLFDLDAIFGFYGGCNVDDVNRLRTQVFKEAVIRVHTSIAQLHADQP